MYHPCAISPETLDERGCVRANAVVIGARRRNGFYRALIDEDGSLLGFLKLAGDVTESRAEIGANQCKGGDRCNRDQCRDQRIFDGRDP